MAPNHLFPFKVGQQAESKSFQRGFRGAWFRCMINKFIQSKDQIKALLEFYDYPGEKMHVTQLYQKPSRNSIGFTDERKAQLILRPSFPPLYRENQMPDPCIISDLIVIVNDVWKVGDLVDWWSDGCYWSGKVIHLLGEDKVKVKLLDPPIGEGKSYEALCNDLRPSLDWSLELGWTVPENEASCCCARLVWPQTKDTRGNEDCTMASNSTSLASCKIQSPVSSARLVASLLPHKDVEQENYEQLVYGVYASCETGASVSSSTLANRLLSPTGSIDPLVNGTPRLCYSGEDNEMEMEVQSTPTISIDPCVNEASRNCCSREDKEMEMEVHSTKISLDLDNDLKEIASGSDKISCTVPTSSRPLEVIEISKTDIGREETERERDVHSTTMDSDDCRRETTSVFRTPQQGSGKEEDTEVQSIDVDDADGRDMMSSSDNPFITTCGLLLPPVEMNEASTQSCPMEVTECGSEVQPTIKNLLDLDTAGKVTASEIAKSFVTLGAMSFPSARHSPETNEKLVTGNTEMEVQPMNLIVDAEDGKRAITNSLDMTLESHEVASPSDKDDHSFRQLPEGLRITEDHHRSEAAEANAIESSIMELEELANKIKWLKGILIFGLQWSNAMKPTWKFSET